MAASAYEKWVSWLITWHSWRWWWAPGIEWAMMYGSGHIVPGLPPHWRTHFIILPANNLMRSHTTLWNSRCHDPRHAKASRTLFEKFEIFWFLTQKFSTGCAWNRQLQAFCRQYTSHKIEWCGVHEAKLMWASLWGSREIRISWSSVVPKDCCHSVSFGHELGNDLTDGRPGGFGL